MVKKTANGWAIVGWAGLYIGWWLTRKDAIEAHCKAFMWPADCSEADIQNDLKSIWKQCQKDGDIAVKVKITYDNNKRRK